MQYYILILESVNVLKNNDYDDDDNAFLSSNFHDI